MRVTFSLNTLPVIRVVSNHPCVAAPATSTTASGRASRSSGQLTMNLPVMLEAKPSDLKRASVIIVMSFNF